MWIERTADFSVQVVAESAALLGLRDEWTRLWRRCRGATAFQAPEWLLPWWERFGNGSLRTLVLRTEGRLAGLLPGYLLDGCFQLIGIGVSDHLDALIEPGFEEEASAEIAEFLTGTDAAWTACEFQQLPSDSALLKPWPHAEWRGWCDEVWVQEVCPALSLPTRAEDLQACLPSRFARNLRYARRLAERQGALAFETAAAETWEAAFDALIALHDRRRAARGEAGAFSDPVVRAFHRQAAASLHDRGWLRLYSLRLDGELIAALYGILANGRFCYYLSGFEPSAARLAPGNLIVEHAISEAIREGAEEFDFLRGGEAYKYQWGAQDAVNFRRRLSRIGLGGV